MYRITAFRRTDGALCMALITAASTSDALAILCALRADGWECRPQKAEVSP